MIVWVIVLGFFVFCLCLALIVARVDLGAERHNHSLTMSALNNTMSRCGKLERELDRSEGQLSRFRKVAYELWAVETVSWTESSGGGGES